MTSRVPTTTGGAAPIGAARRRTVSVNDDLTGILRRSSERRQQRKVQAQAQELLNTAGINADAQSRIQELQTAAQIPETLQQIFANVAPPPPQEEVGGLVGKALGLPGVLPVIGALGFAQEKILDPAQALLATGAQTGPLGGLFAGLGGMIRQDAQEAAQEVREAGGSVAEQARAATEAATTGDLGTLPFVAPGVRVPLPEFLVGEGRSLEDIDRRDILRATLDPTPFIPAGIAIRSGIRQLSSLTPGTRPWITIVKRTPRIAEEAAEVSRRADQQLIGFFKVKGPRIEPPPPGVRRAGGGVTEGVGRRGGESLLPDLTTTAGIREEISNLDTLIARAGRVEESASPVFRGRTPIRPTASVFTQERDELVRFLAETEAREVAAPGVATPTRQVPRRSPERIAAAEAAQVEADLGVQRIVQRTRATREAPLRVARQELKEAKTASSAAEAEVGALNSRIRVAETKLAGETSLKVKAQLTQRLKDLKQQLPGKQAALESAFADTAVADDVVRSIVRPAAPPPSVTDVPLDAVAVPPPVTGTALDRTMTAIKEQGVQSARPTVVAAQVRVLEETLDQFDGINASARRADIEKVKQTGGHLADAENAELHASLLRGAVSAGVQRFDEVLIQAKKTLGRGIDNKHMAAYLTLKFQEEILRMNPDRLIPGGLKNLDEVQKAISQIKDTIGLEGAARVEAGAAVIRDGYRELLDAKVRSGLVTREVADLLNDRFPWYNPIKFVEHVEAQNMGQGSRAISVSSDGIKALSEMGSEGALLDPLITGYHAMGRSEMLIRRNDAARALVGQLQLDPQTSIRKLAEGERILPGEGTITNMVGGNPVRYAVPSWVEREAKNFAITELSTLELVGRTMNALPRALLVNYNPAFLSGQFMFDMMTVMATQGVMPWRTVQALYRNLLNIVREDKVFNQMIKSGGDVSGWWGAAPEEQLRKINRAGNLGIRSGSDYKRLFTRPWDTFKEIAHATELAPRRAVFERRLAKGDTAALAALNARRSTVDFARGGRAVRMANSYFLFLNPALQGTVLPFRALRGGIGMNAAAARTGIGGYLAAQAAAYGWNSQFEEYNDLPLFDKYGKLTIMLPSDEVDRFGNTVPHSVNLVPFVREFAAFSAPMIRMLDQLRGKDVESFGTFLKALVGQLNPAGSITDLGVPTHIGALLAEITVNRDTFRDRDVVPPELIGLPAAEQFDEDSSEASKRLGAWLDWSPKKIDHLLKSGVGVDLLTLADSFLREKSGVDVEADAIVAYLEDVRDRFPEDDARKMRNLILGELDRELRDRVEEIERAPAPQIPFISTIQNRFYRARGGGQLYRAGLEAAAGEAGINERQLRAVNGALGNLSDDLFEGQQQRDADFAKGTITGAQWRGGRKDDGAMWQGTLMGLGKDFPRVTEMLANPALAQQFYTTLHTIGGKIKDKRTKIELLVAGYNSIPVDDISPGIEDWQTHFESKDAFLATLTPAEQRDVNDERRSRMTAFERGFDDFANPNGRARAYWDVPKTVTTNSGNPAITEQLYREFQRLPQGESPLREAFLVKFPSMVQIQQAIEGIRASMRQLDPELDAFLFRFNYTNALSEANAGREFELRPSLALNQAVQAIR